MLLSVKKISKEKLFYIFNWNSNRMSGRLINIAISTKISWLQFFLNFSLWFQLNWNFLCLDLDVLIGSRCFVLSESFMKRKNWVDFALLFLNDIQFLTYFPCRDYWGKKKSFLEPYKLSFPPKNVRKRGKRFTLGASGLQSRTIPFPLKRQ